MYQETVHLTIRELLKHLAGVVNYIHCNSVTLKMTIIVPTNSIIITKRPCNYFEFVLSYFIWSKI